MHYTVAEGELIYASEIKSILQHPDYHKKFNAKALDNYLSFQYVVPPETFLKIFTACCPDTIYGTVTAK